MNPCAGRGHPKSDDRQHVTGSDGDDGSVPQAQCTAVETDHRIITAVGHGINRVEAKGPQKRGQPTTDQGRLQGQAPFSCSPGDQHGKAPAEGQHRLGVGEPALGGGIEQDRWQGADGEQQAQLPAGFIKAENHGKAEGQQNDQQHQGCCRPDRTPGQGTLFGPFHPAIKTAVPEIVGDAAGTTHSQATNHDLQKQIQSRRC